MTAPTNPALARVFARLAGLRTRIRFLVAFSGTARVIAAAGAILVAWLLADWLLDLPLGVRRFIRLGLLDRPADLTTAVYLGLLAIAGLLFLITVRHRSGIAALFAFTLAGAPGVVLWILGRHVFSPLAARLPDEALALTVEQRFPSLNERLASALDFHREIAAPTRGESVGMMSRVVEEASRDVEALRFSGVASAKNAGQQALLALASVGLFVGIVLADSATASLWVRRSLYLEEVPWPRATTLVVVLVTRAGEESEKVAAEPYVATLGQSLSVYVRALGKVPSEVEIVDRVRSLGGPERPLSHRMRAVPGHEGLFEHEFRDVRGDFEFFARGGDDRDEFPLYSVSVRVPPRITSVRCDLTFPEYLGLAPRRVDGGSIAVPDGTRVRVAFESDSEVARAEAFLNDVAVPLEREGTTFRFAFAPTATSRYRLRVVTPDGRENDAAADTYEVTVEPDTPPRSEWVYPRGPVEVTAKGRVPLFAQTEDDHGLKGLRIEVDAGGSKPQTIALAARTTAAPDEANDRPYGAHSILTYVPLEVPTLVDKDGKPLVPPTRPRVRIVAVDSKGQESTGPWAPIDVLRPDEIQRGFAAQRARAKSDVEEVRTSILALEKQSNELAAAVELSEADRALLRDMQFTAGRTRDNLERVTRTIGGLFTAYVYDRLGAEAPTAALLALLDRRHRATFSRAADAKPAASSDGTGSASTGGASGADTDVFSFEVYREVVAARRDRLVFDTGEIDKMISVLDKVVDAAQTRGFAAHAAATTAARDGTPATRKALAEAVVAWHESVDQAIAAMAEWQSLAELTLALRKMIDRQEEILKGTGDLGKQRDGRRDDDTKERRPPETPGSRDR